MFQPIAPPVRAIVPVRAVETLPPAQKMWSAVKRPVTHAPIAWFIVRVLPMTVTGFWFATPVVNAVEILSLAVKLPAGSISFAGRLEIVLAA